MKGLKLAVLAVLAAVGWPISAQAQVYEEWVNNTGNVLIATVQSPGKSNCTSGALCDDKHSLNIGKGWEVVDAFITHISWLPGSNAGFPVSRLRAEIGIVYYDDSTGDLDVEVRGQIDNGRLGDFEFMIHYVIIATRDRHGAGYQPVRMESFDNDCTGDTDFGCASLKSFPASKTQFWTFAGFGIQSIDMEITSGAASEPRSVFFQGMGSGTTNNANTSQQLSCGIIDDQGLPFSCSTTGKIISAKPSVLAQGAAPNWTEYFSITIPMGTSRVEQQSAPSDVKTGLVLLGAFTFDRNGYGGAPYYAPTYYLGAGCGWSDFDDSTGTFYVEWTANWRDRTLSPWGWYDADVSCRRSWFMAEDP